MATLTRKIAHNTLYQLVSKSITTAIGIAVVVLLTRYLDPKGYGQYTTVIAFLQFFAIIVDFGLYITLTTKIAEEGIDEDKLVSNIFTIRLLSAVLFLGAAPFVALLFPYDPLVKTGIALTSFSFLFITLNQVLWGVFQKHLQMIKISISEVAGRIVLLGGTVLAIFLHLDLLWILTAVVAGSFINFLFTYLFVRRMVRLKLDFDRAQWKDIFRTSWPVALSVVFTLIYFKADTLILQHYHGDVAVGLYGAPYKVLEVMVTFPAMFAGLALPVLAQSFNQQDTERFSRVLQKALDFLAIAALPVVCGMLFVAEPLMVLISGEDYRASGGILRILIIATGIIFVGNLFGNTIVAINKQRPMILVYVVIAAIAVTGYYTFIPQFSYYGAAWMTVVAEGLVAGSSAIMVYASTKTRPQLTVVGKALLASLIMSVVLAILPSYHVLLLIIIAAAVYVVALVALKAVSRETLQDILSKKS